MNTVRVSDQVQIFKENLIELKVEGSDKAIVFLGGIHGNEASGYNALKQNAQEIISLKDHLKGDVYAIGGNLQALSQDKRFIERDLNRIWLHKNVDLIESGALTIENAENEWKDFVRIYLQLKELLNSGKELFIIDLHTTSSPSVPFITINDMIKNRKYSEKFPVPIILGIEEYLSGPLLSYMNEFGHVSMAFEAGQHYADSSFDAHEAFVWLSMVHAGILDRKDVKNFEEFEDRLRLLARNKDEIYEVRYRKEVHPEDQFEMLPGFSNFSPIKKDQLLAKDDSGPLKAHINGSVFMPLYQKEGTDGYFIIREIPRWALSASRFLRRINFDGFLVLLPGISWSNKEKGALVVNPRIARFLSVELFHLLGYRRKARSGEKFVFSKREIT